TCKVDNVTFDIMAAKSVMHIRAVESGDSTRTVYNDVMRTTSADVQKLLTPQMCEQILWKARSRRYPDKLHTFNEIDNFLRGGSKPEITKYYAATVEAPDKKRPG
ncbi:MAG: hypothetical protein Q8O19_05380, partial [Rectinemataceae bacterium]|nr:hypothetical protein [Rectinemataceae bacterium]